MSLFSIITAAYVTFSPVPLENARQKLGVYAAFRTLKTGLQLQTFDTMQSDALAKRQCVMAQRVRTLMELAVPSFVCLHARAKNLCTILIDLILTWKSGTLYFYSCNMLTECPSVCTLSDGLLRITARLLS
jgi:hypothetical protein